MAGHETLGAVHVLLFHPEILLNPVEPAEMPYPIIEQSAAHIADGGIDDERDRMQAGGEQAEHHRLAAEREDAAGQEGGQQHAPISVVEKKLSDYLHILFNRLQAAPLQALSQTYII